MLDLLQTFCSVVDAGSLNKAAEALHLTQPAITRQIKLLESRLGALLLIRNAQGVSLTPAGEAVLKHARQALAAVAACEGAAAAVSGAARESLRITAGLHVTLYCLPELLERFQAEHPEIRVDLRPAPHRTAVQRLLQYESDIALIGVEVAVPGVREIPLFPDPFVMISAPGAEEGPVGLADLEGRTLLALEPGAAPRRELDAVLERHAIDCRLVEFPGTDMVKMGVMLGMGDAVVPRSAARPEAEQGRLVMRGFADWSGPERLVRALVRAEGSLPAPVRLFLELVRVAVG